MSADEKPDLQPSDSPVDAPPPPRRTRSRRRGPHPDDPAARTRTSATWTAVAVVVLLGVALVDFIAENTRSVQIDFFSANGRIPVAVALIAAALAGAAVVLGVGVSRTAQLRWFVRRRRAQAAVVEETNATPE